MESHGGAGGWGARSCSPDLGKEDLSLRRSGRKSRVNRARRAPSPQKPALFRPPARTALCALPALPADAKHFRKPIEPIAVQRKANHRPIGAPLSQRKDQWLRVTEREAANEGGLFRWPRGGGISAASSRRLPVVAGLGPGFEPEPRERVSVAEAAGGCPPGSHLEGCGRGTGRALQEVHRSARCLRTGRCPVGARHSSCPCRQGWGLGCVVCTLPECRPHPDPIVTAGSGLNGAEEGWAPQKPRPHDLILNVNRAIIVDIDQGPGPCAQPFPCLISVNPPHSLRGRDLYTPIFQKRKQAQRETLIPGESDVML